MKKVMAVFGTRPEAIKMAPVVHALKARPTDFDVQVCVTGQHREMLDQVLNLFNIRPDFDLSLMRKGQDLFDVTSAVLTAMRDVYCHAKPDLVLVHGDTTSAMGASLAAFYLGIEVGHVEAGLRSGSLLAPFPEEFNRKCVSMIANWHFAPTTSSETNLLTEKVPPDKIWVTGNTVIDALIWMLAKIEEDEVRAKELAERLDVQLSLIGKPQGLHWSPDIAEKIRRGLQIFVRQ